MLRLNEDLDACCQDGLKHTAVTLPVDRSNHVLSTCRCFTRFLRCCIQELCYTQMFSALICDFSTLHCMVLWPSLIIHENMFFTSLQQVAYSHVVYSMQSARCANKQCFDPKELLTVRCLSSQILHMYECSTSSPSQERRKCMDVKSCV
jgi:hypothetical protein